ncbi:unnamed protein product, partial [Owenia fusiformis]
KKTWQYKSCNLDNLNNLILNQNWHDIIATGTVNASTQAVTNKLTSIFNDNIPFKTKISKSNDMPWFDNEIKMELNKRDKLYKKFKRNNTEINKTNYKDQVKIVEQKVKLLKDNYENKICDDLQSFSSGSKFYWQAIKKLLGTRFTPSIPTLFSSDLTRVFSTDKDKATELLNHFTSKFHHDFDFDQRDLPTLQMRTNKILTNISTNREEVRTL